MRAARVRAVRETDYDKLVRFYGNLSAESYHSRFMICGHGIPSDRARSLCGPDHVHEQGFVADVGRGGDHEVVGHICLVEASPRVLEIGIAVADAWQGRGIGRRLFAAAVDWAARHGVELLIATAFADNSRVLALLSSSAYPTCIGAAEAGTVSVEIRTSATPAGDRVDDGLTYSNPLAWRLATYAAA